VVRPRTHPLHGVAVDVVERYPTTVADRESSERDFKLLVTASLNLRSQKLLDVLVRASKLLNRASKQSIGTLTVIFRSKTSFSLQPRPRQADVVSSRDVRFVLLAFGEQELEATANEIERADTDSSLTQRREPPHVHQAVNSGVMPTREEEGREGHLNTTDVSREPHVRTGTEASTEEPSRLTSTLESEAIRREVRRNRDRRGHQESIVQRSRSSQHVRWVA
jgi:hypothetical protein